MPCPFPGMDPYIERPEIWPDFHDSLIAAVRGVPLNSWLPRVSIPLSADDADVPLEVQAAMTRCWDEGPYPKLLLYDEKPPGALSDAETQWCKQTLLETDPRSFH